MAVLTDPRYQQLAAIAAGQLGAGPNVQRAILAQFACEKGGEWPPQDNSPGNMHTGPMAEIGYSLPGGIGDNGQVARWPTPQDGARGYAAYMGRHPAMVGTRAPVARDDGLGYINAATAAGYGTSRSCWLSNYPQARPTGTTGLTVGPGISAGPGVVGGGGIDGPRLATMLGHRTSDRLTAADIDKLSTAFAASGAPDPAGTGSLTFRVLLHQHLDKYVGTPFSQIPDVSADIQAAASGAGIVALGIGTTPVGVAAGGAATAAGAAADAAGQAVGVALGAVVPIVVGAVIILGAGALFLSGARDAVG